MVKFTVVYFLRHAIRCTLPTGRQAQFIFITLLSFWTLNAYAQSTVSTYDQLLHAIRETRQASAHRIEAAVQQEKVREAWETGKLIDEHILLRKERAKYGAFVIKKLAKDLGTDRTELYRMLEFARIYPKVEPAQQLSWSHYASMLALNDPEAVKEMAKKAAKEKWTRDQVREEVRKRKPVPLFPNELARQAGDLRLPETNPGNLYTYRVVKASAGPYKDQLALDLGFSNYFIPKEIRKFKENDLVILEKGKLKLFKGSNDDRYTYSATVTQVVDGDTVHALVDLGFNILTEQKLRLRGIDAPEMESKEGKEAKAFVEEGLLSRQPSVLSREKESQGSSQKTEDLPSVLIKTHKSDKYDRYLVDVFIPVKSFELDQKERSKIDGDFFYLNQKLLDEGMAVRMNE